MAGKGFAFLMEMGCGKSLTAIAVMGALLQQGKIERVLVAAPGSVVSVWQSELEKFADFGFSFAALLGTKPQRLRKLRSLEEDGSGLLIAGINYESTFRDGIFEALLAFGADLVICDESQRIKNPKAQQTRAMVTIGKRAAYRLALTGTPVQQDAKDVFSQWQFLDDTIFGDNVYAFEGRYCRKGGFGGKQIVGTKNEDEMIERMHSIAYRVTKNEALDLPPETYEYRTVELSPQERRIYDEMRKCAVIELSEEKQVSAATVLTKLLRLQQIAGGFLKADDDAHVTQIGTSKLDALEDIIEDYVLSEGRKLVVFARFLAEVEAIEALLHRRSIQHRVITGAVPLAQRGKIVDDFQTDPDTMIFVAQTQTAGLGITLHAASVAVFYSLSYNYADYQQALARIHRKGQHHPCTYVHLIADRTVDSKIMSALEKKGDMAKSIVDNWQTYFE